MKPEYYKTLWHNCNKCKIHYMSELPHLTAYLCDECYKSIPHYRVTMPSAKTIKKHQQAKRGPTYAWLDNDWPLEYILLYILGCSLCLLTIGYYLWFK